MHATAPGKVKGTHETVTAYEPCLHTSSDDLTAVIRFQVRRAHSWETNLRVCCGMCVRACMRVCALSGKYKSSHPPPS
jgi:hypothetical protein